MTPPRIEPYQFEGHLIGARPDFSMATPPAFGGDAAIQTMQYWLFEFDGKEYKWQGTPATMESVKRRLGELASNLIAQQSRPRGNVP